MSAFGTGATRDVHPMLVTSLQTLWRFIGPQERTALCGVSRDIRQTALSLVECIAGPCGNDEDIRVGQRLLWYCQNGTMRPSKLQILLRFDSNPIALFEARSSEGARSNIRPGCITHLSLEKVGPDQE